MAEKEDIYLVRIYRSNGDLVELRMQAPDDRIALDNAEKSFDREFILIEDNQTKILEERLNE